MSLLKDQIFDGIVTKVSRYKENDALVYMLTKQFGIRTFYVRGFGKSTSKLTGILMPFNYGEYLGSISDDGFSYITSANKITNFNNIVNDIEKNAYSSFVVDLVNHAFEQEESISEKWFNFIIKSLELINDSLDAQIICNIVQIKLLNVFGVTPNFKNCVIGNESQGDFDYSIVLGGIICSKHYGSDLNRVHAGQRVIYYLRLFSQIDLSNIKSIKVLNSTKKQLQNVIDMIYEDSVGISLKSRKFIEQINNFKEF